VLLGKSVHLNHPGRKPISDFGLLPIAIPKIKVSVSVYLGTTTNKHQIMQQKNKHYHRAAFILFFLLNESYINAVDSNSPFLPLLQWLSSSLVLHGKCL